MTPHRLRHALKLSLGLRQNRVRIGNGIAGLADAIRDAGTIILIT